MKRFALVLALLLSLSSVVSACSSFAVYGDQVVYGMNFDFDPRLEVKFSINESTQGQFFATSFKRGNVFQELVGINDKGLFGTLQVVPQLRIQMDNAQAMMISYLFEQGLRQASTIGDITKIAANYRLVYPPGFGLHSMFADLQGNAIIYEVGQRENKTVEMGGDYIVMTNFQNSDFVDVPVDKIRAPGSDRYVVAHRTIQDSLPHFGLEQALDVLEKTKQTITRSSIVCFPELNTIYLSIEGDFGRVWRIDLRQKIIETFRGFSKDRSEPLRSEGITLSTLKSWI